jgi:hypothetical protein
MGQRIPEVDRYIDAAAPFAQPILRRLRDLFHEASPLIQEKIKWGCPSFEHKGIVGGMAAFKKHVAWGLWKAALLDGQGAMRSSASSHMSGGSPTDVSELPSDKTLLALIRKAVDLNERGVKTPKREKPKAKPLPKLPADFATALRAEPRAASTYKAFSPSHKREYVEWVTEAKQPQTRARRIAQAVAWMTEGKPRNWKYVKRT